MISVFDIFLKMLKFVAPFNTKIVIMINVTRFVILGDSERKVLGVDMAMGRAV